MATRRARPRTLALSLVAVLLLLAPSVAATSYVGPLQRDFVRQELLRMINGERALRGLKAIKLDTLLAARAHDAPVRCPNDASRLNQGRALSIATQNAIPAPHALPLCKSYTVLSVLPYWKYSDSRAEILAVNNQDFSRVRYDYGCPTGSQLTCGKSRYTYAPATAAQAMRMWMNSSGHRGKVLGRYSRVGCGAWQGGTAQYGGYSFANTRWYACIFGTSGPSSNKDLAAPTIGGVTVDGKAYTAGMSVGAGVAVRFTLADTGGPYPRVSDWWAYIDGNSSRDRVGFREGAFDAAGSSADVAFSVDLSSLSAGAHSLTIVGRAMDTRRVTVTLDLRLGK